MTVHGTPKNSGNIIRTHHIVKELKKLGHNVNNIPPVRSILYSFPFYLCQTLIDEKIYDIVFVSKPYLNASIVAFLKKIQDSVIIADIDDLTFMYHKNGLTRSVLKIMEDFLPKYFDLVCVHSQKIGNYMLAHGVESKKLYYLPNGVDLSLFNPRSYRGEVYRKKLGLKDERIILYLANLGISSEFEVILKSLHKIISKENKFVVVGTGSLINHYKKLVKRMNLTEHVIFTDHVLIEDIPGYISMADCCIVYYSNKDANYYRTSMKIREYLSMGKPVVCNNLGDLENFKDYTFNFQSLSNFKIRILQVLDNKVDLSRVVQGQSYVRRVFSWKRIVKDFDKRLRYCKLLRSKGSS